MRIIQAQFQKNPPMLVHIQLRPEVRSFALLDRDNTGNEFCCGVYLLYVNDVRR